MARGLVAVFHELDAAIDAIEALKKRNFTQFTVYTPTPRHEIEHAVKPPGSPVRRYTLIGALAGMTFGYWVAVWTSDYWPLVVGGKAVAAWIPYTIISFELMVLVGSLATVAGMFVNSRIPKIITTVGFDPRFTAADFGIYVEAAPERLKEAEATLRENGAAEVRDER
jgi:ActD protein